MLAVWTISTEIVVITFDKPLQVGTSAPGNWELRASARDRSMDAPTHGALTVQSPTTMVGGLQFGSFVNYLATPQELVGVNGLPVAPFSFTPVFVAF